MRQKLLRLLALLLCIGCLTAAEHRGTIKFGNQAIPGATITAQQGDRTVTTISDPGGSYVFPDLTPGTWTVEVKMLGFAPLKREVIVPETGPAPPWDLVMLPLQEITSVAPAQLEVKAVEAPKPEAAQAKPKPGDVKTTATNTTSGFQRTNVTAAPARSNAPGQVDSTAPEPPSADLARNANDGFLINGSVNNGASSQFSQQAAFGNNRGPKRWQYNGNFGFQLDNSSLDARQYSLTGQDTLRPGYSKFTGLAAIGGPLRLPFIKKTGPNFQLNYQWTRNRNATTSTSLVPTAAERIGDFSQTVTPLGQPVQVLDPTTGLPFAGNQIPLARISSQAKELVKFYPLPNFTSQARYNFQVPLVSGTHADNLQFRTNRQIGRKNNIQGQFLYTSNRGDTPSLFGFLDTNRSKTTNANVSLRHNFSNRFYINTAVSFNRTAFTNTPFFANQTNISQMAGVTGNNQEPINWGPPTLNFLSSGITTLNDVQASRNRNQNAGISVDGFYSRGGKHNLTYGMTFNRLQNNVLSQQDPRGTFGFTGQTAGSDFAGFLLGTPDTSSIAFGNADKYYRSNQWGAFVADDFRARTGLTFNVALRWDYNSPISELYNRLVNLDVTRGFTAAAPVLATSPTGTASGIAYPGSLMKPDKNNFGPRISLAWRPLAASSMVVRASYGLGYDTSVYQSLAQQMAQQAPLSTSIRVQTTAANPLSLANGFIGSPQFSPTLFGVDPNFRVGYAQTWQVSVQRDLPFALQMLANYSGIKGTRGQQQFLPNTYAAGTPTSAICNCPSGFTYLTSNGNSTRESGMLQLRRRLRRGLQADMTYTYAHSIDDSALGGAGIFTAQNWQNLSGERGRSNFDQRHLLQVNAQYTTGATSGMRFLMEGKQGKFFREWTVGTQLQMGTGLPLTPTIPAVASGSGISGSLRPDYTGQPVYDNNLGLHLNPAAFVAPVAGTYGNAGRNTITGPSQFSLNATLGRTLRVGDRFSADIRLDSTNILNHPVFPNWTTVISSKQYGLPVAANGMRNVLTTLRMRF